MLVCAGDFIAVYAKRKVHQEDIVICVVISVA